MMEVSNFGVMMAIFGALVLLAGLYMFTGHRLGIMTGRASFKNLTKEKWKNIGKWTMVASMVIFAVAILGFIFNF